jgi:hypothetical protein
MGINEDIVSLRERMTDAVERRFFDKETGGFVQVSLIQIMKEAERKRQSCAKQAEHFRSQAVNAEGQAAAYGTISSIVNAVFQSMLSAEERRSAEEEENEKRLKEEKEERAAAATEATSKTTKKTAKKTTKRTRTRKTE